MNISNAKFQENIKTYNNKIIIPELNTKIFNILDCSKDDTIIKKTYYENTIINENFNISYDKLYNNKDDLNDKLKITKIYNLFPSVIQSKILLFWFDLYIDMYNKVLEKIKNIHKKEKLQDKNIKLNNLDLDLDLSKMKKEFSNYKKELSNKINPFLNKKSKINLHILDYAIKDAITSIKSIISNLNNNHIKHSRLRYLKKNKNFKILKIEKHICSVNSFCSSILGKIITIKPEINFNDITEVAILQYDKKNNKFTFYVKEKVEINENINENKIISLDPGCRTFLTGISKDHILEAGINPLSKIKKINIKMDNIKSKKKLKNRRKKLKKYENKIKNKINDMHNKIIKELVSNYDNILIGNMSTKKIVETDTTNKELKRNLNNLKMFIFKQKLKIKCIKENKKYKEINECNTSKTCSNCGNIKNDLKGNKKYECKKCNKHYDRDVNACKNILLKAL
jgi:transposase